MIGTGAHFLTAFITAWVLAMELEKLIIRADGVAWPLSPGDWCSHLATVRTFAGGPLSGQHPGAGKLGMGEIRTPAKTTLSL